MTRTLLSIVAATGVLAACQQLDDRRPLPALDEQAFRCTAQPVLAARCSVPTCHGNLQRPYRLYAPGRLRLNLPPQDLMSPLTAAEQQANYEMSRALADTESPSESWLLLKPLDVDAGGLYHGERYYSGHDVFLDTEDRGFQLLSAWLGGAQSPSDCVPSTEVGP